MQLLPLADHQAATDRESLLLIDGIPSPSPASTKRRQCSLRTAVLAIVMLTVALAAALVGLGITSFLSAAQKNPGLSAECLHALGGGIVSPGGGFDQRVIPAKCTSQLLNYANPSDGPYWKEVSLAAAEAIEALNLEDACKAAAPHVRTMRALLPLTISKQSLLSSSSSRSSRGSNPRSLPRIITSKSYSSSSSRSSQPYSLPPPSKDQLVIFDIDETLLSNLPFTLNPNGSTWDDWVAAAAAPPLLPTRCFYLSLQAAGYSVAFITGRREKARNATLVNLEKAGFGKPCLGDGSIPSLGNMPNTFRERSSSGAVGDNSKSSSSTRSSSTASSSSSKGATTSEPQCFIALFMRPEGDTRLASVYKPSARKQMLDMLQLSYNQSDTQISLQQQQQQQQSSQHDQQQQEWKEQLFNEDDNQPQQQQQQRKIPHAQQRQQGWSGQLGDDNKYHLQQQWGGEATEQVAGAFGNQQTHQATVDHLSPSSSVSGMTLLALVGDQFSDLNGENSAPFAFKLPNPFYYIL